MELLLRNFISHVTGEVCNSIHAENNPEEGKI